VVMACGRENAVSPLYWLFAWTFTIRWCRVRLTRGHQL